MLAGVWLLAACGGGSNAPRETVRSGTLHVAVDESLKPVFEAGLASFRFSSPEAEVVAHYVPEGDAVRLFMSDSCPLVALARPLTSDETAWFRTEKRFTPQSTWVLNDAVAVVVHPSRRDTALTTDQLARLLRGEVGRWDQLGSTGRDSVRIVVAGAGSSLLRSLRDSLLAGQLPGVRVFALDSTPAVLDYVASHPAALGLVGFAWLSDDDSEAVRQRRSRVKLLSVAGAGNSRPISLTDHPLNALSSSRANLRYPLRRRVYLHNRQARTGLALGVAAYLAGQEGQRIVAKSNLVPTTGVIRLVEVQEQAVPRLKP
jgi:phosphate transport system substrate-binding protein